MPGPHAGPVPQAQVPLVQRFEVVALQAWQASPGRAQVASDWAVHTVPAQQPLAQDEALQTQRPPLQV